MKPFVIIGCDTSFSAFGICVVSFQIHEPIGVHAPILDRVHCEVLTSKPDNSGALSKGEDTSRRLREYFRRLHTLALENSDVLAVEATGFMPGRSHFRTIHTTARARQIVDDVGAACWVPVIEVTSSDVGKKAVDKPKGKSPKEERVASLSERHPLFAAALSHVKPSLAEHAADAFATVLVAMPRALQSQGYSKLAEYEP